MKDVTVEGRKVLREVKFSKDFQHELSRNTRRLASLERQISQLTKKIAEIEGRQGHTVDLSETLAEAARGAMGGFTQDQQVRTVLDENGDGYGRVDLGENYWLLVTYVRHEPDIIRLERPSGERVSIADATDAEMERVHAR
ncbi:MAG: hypothetical protein M3P94_06970 [Chloroflexota bacterium]|nr:hypothetical protein [Chloroflexota bacterium]